MFILISLVLVLFFFCGFSKSIKRNAGWHYIFTIVLAVATIVLSNRKILFELPDFLRVYVIPVFMNATIATAIFIVVMYLGAIPKNLKITKTLMPIRGELSIIASILTLAHNIVYGKVYFVALFKKPLFPLPLNFKLASIVSLLMLCIMLPLFITSFRRVRKMMKAKTWKKLQRFAYLFYAFIWLHIMLIYFPAFRSGNFKNIIIYSLIFGIYLILKIIKSQNKKIPITNL